jgi:hypothetical protein
LSVLEGLLRVTRTNTKQHEWPFRAYRGPIICHNTASLYCHFFLLLSFIFKY